MNESMVKKMEDLFDELVPDKGKADTEAGEIVRAYNRIAYRWLNDGDMLGVGYGNETCNAAGRYLLKHDHGEKAVAEAIGGMWGQWSDNYEENLEDLGWAVLRLIEEHPETRSNGTEDMWDHFDKYEDVDDAEDDWYDDDEEW